MVDDAAPNADEVAGKHFSTAFRGFDQYEVRAFLASLAAQLTLLREHERALRERLAEVEASIRPAGPLNDDELEAALGAETTRVLHAARAAASEIRARAEDNVARLLREAQDEAAALRSESEVVLRRRTDEAEAAAALILEAAQQKGRDMLAEAQALRDRMLKDLSRRRRQAEAHLEALATGRAEVVSALESAAAAATHATAALAELHVDAEAEEPIGAEPEPEVRPEPVAERRPEAEPELLAEPAPEPVPAAEQEPALEQERELVATREPADPAELPRGDAARPDERRSSSLRLLRRRAEPFQQDLGDDLDEGVRIIRPERPVLAAVPQEPDPEPVAVWAPDPVVAADDTADAADDPHQPVDDLFARLRADRAAAVANAEEVLARHDDAVPAAVAPPPAEPPSEKVLDGLFEQRDAALEDIERALVRSLKRALSDEQNEVLDALRRLRGRPRVEAIVPEPAVHQARYAAVAADALTSAAGAGAAVHDGGGVDARALGDALGDELATDLRNRVSRAIEAGRDDDEALVEAISAGYREWKSARAEALARHHVAAAYAYGCYTAAPAGRLVWLVDPAEGGCPDCDDNALAGPTPKGEAYPTGQHHPPAHAGCRCLLVPVS